LKAKVEKRFESSVVFCKKKGKRGCGVGKWVDFSHFLILFRLWKEKMCVSLELEKV
jgi:hypothetical protein